ncbi:hypothetical protein [Nostoc sp.]|uniref:hypothetical protein n=1 Tax=Nostoc sp. TaxID=1180 RepID=UPI002FF89204
MLSHLGILLIEFDFIYFFDEVTSYDDLFDDNPKATETSPALPASTSTIMLQYCKPSILSIVASLVQQWRSLKMCQLKASYG